jgi:hypothetical protein
VLLFGIGMFSYVMSNFQAILNDFNKLNSDLDESDQLSQFFGLFTRYNGNVPLEHEFRHRIESHFDHRWFNDNNVALSKEEDIAIYDQLPDDTKISLLINYLHQGFLIKFRDFFRLHKTTSVHWCELFPEDHDFVSPRLA